MRWKRTLALCAVATLGLAACGGDDDSTDTGDETTTTAAAEEGDTTTTAEDEDDGEGTASELEVTGDTVEYAGATIEVTSGSFEPIADSDPEVADVTLEVEFSNDTEYQVNPYMQATLEIDGEDFDLSGADYIDLDPGKKTSLTYTVADVPGDADWDDMTLLLGEDGTAPAVYPLTTTPPESPLPVSIEPDETFQFTDESDVPFDFVVKKITRSLDAVENDTMIRAEEGTSFLIYDVSITAGVESPYISRDFLRMQAGGEVTDPRVGTSDYIAENTVKEWQWVLVVPDDADDAVVRVGYPSKDPNFLQWPVAFDELGGELSDGLPVKGSDDDEDDEDSTSTTEEE